MQVTPRLNWQTTTIRGCRLSNMVKLGSCKTIMVDQRAKNQNKKCLILTQFINRTLRIQLWPTKTEKDQLLRASQEATHLRLGNRIIRSTIQLNRLWIT